MSMWLVPFGQLFCSVSLVTGGSGSQVLRLQSPGYKHREDWTVCPCPAHLQPQEWREGQSDESGDGERDSQIKWRWRGGKRRWEGTE